MIGGFTSSFFAVVLVAVWSALPPKADVVRIGVFGLFRPTTLMVTPAQGGLTVRTDRDTCTVRGTEEVRLREARGAVQVACAGRTAESATVRIAGLDGLSQDVDLQVPGRIRRRFSGVIEVNGVGRRAGAGGRHGSRRRRSRRSLPPSRRQPRRRRR